MNRMTDSEDFGKEVGLVHRAIVTGRKVGAQRDFWIRLAEDEEMFRQVLRVVNNSPTYDIVVDGRRTLDQMIEAGNYDWVNDDINDNLSKRLDYFSV
ncbi:hypothetical protein ACFLZC_02510 [Patescibacteria group bacterium]